MKFPPGSRLHYILDDAGQPVPCDDLMTWAAWMESASEDRSRVVAQDKDEGAPGGEILISTVFLGLDHNYMPTGPPVLWETMVFGGPLDKEMGRYTSREAALAGHQRWCQLVRKAVER